MNRFNFSLLVFILLIQVVILITLSPLTYWDSTNDNNDEISFTQEQVDSLIVKAITDSLDSITPVTENTLHSLVISPTKMNVFYRGLPNPVDVSVPGVANDKLRVNISSGHKIRKQPDGSYIVEPSSSNSNKVFLLKNAVGLGNVLSIKIDLSLSSALILKISGIFEAISFFEFRPKVLIFENKIPDFKLSLEISFI